jgi:hypothetical protein
MKGKLNINKEEKKALDGIKFEQLSGVVEDVSNKIVEVIKDRNKVIEFTDLSIDEIKDVLEVRVLGKAIDDDIMLEYGEEYPRAKRSNNGKGWQGLIDMVIAKVQESRGGIPGWFDRNILGKRDGGGN